MCEKNFPFPITILWKRCVLANSKKWLIDKNSMTTTDYQTLINYNICVPVKQFTL